MFNLQSPESESYRKTVGLLLDNGYNDAALRMLSNVGNIFTPNSELSKLFNDYLDGIKNNADAYDSVANKNDFLKALRSEYRQQAQVIANYAPDIERAGIDIAAYTSKETVKLGTPDASSFLDQAWNRPSPDAIASVVDIANSDAWNEWLNNYPDAMTGETANLLTTMFADGVGSRAAAREFQDQVEGMSRAVALNMTRTLYLTSWRQSTHLHYLENRDILSYQIRIAVLDARVCPACLALHGKEYPLDELIDDHNAGRCTSVPAVKGFSAPEIQTGEEWLAEQNDAKVIDIMGVGGAKAWKDYNIPLNRWVTTRKDPIFGRQTESLSLQNVLARSGRDKSGNPFTSFKELPISDALSRYTRGDYIAKGYMPSDTGYIGNKIVALNARVNDLSAEMDRVGYNDDRYPDLWRERERLFKQIDSYTTDMISNRDYIHAELQQPTEKKLKDFEIYVINRDNKIEKDNDTLAKENSPAYQAKEWLRGVINGDETRVIAGRNSIHLDGLQDGRAYQLPFLSATYTGGIPVEKTPVTTFVHEFGHQLESDSYIDIKASGDRRWYERAKEFIAYRTEGDAYQRMADLFPNAGYKPDEITKPDDFIHPYIGKYYEESKFDKSTEVISMGLEELYRDPVGFYKRDPEHFNFIVGLINGDL